MFKIVICDDEKVLQELNEKAASNIMDKLNIEASFAVFNDGEALIEEYKQGKRFDIILLDYMMNTNGIEIARQILEYDLSVIIIFISSYKEPVFRSFEVGAFRYIIKGDDFEKNLEEALTQAIKRIKKQRHFIEIKTNEGETNLNLFKVLYFESKGHKISAITSAGNFEFHNSIRSLWKIVKNYNFISPHRAYLVNMRYIEYIRENDIKLKNGDIILLSRYKKAQVKKIFKEYIKSITVF